MNWQEQLGAFLRDNPDLPAGPDIPDADNSDTDTYDPRSQPRLDISIQRKGRAGKTVTLIAGFQLPPRQILDIASKIKSSLGAGGSVQDSEIIIQGDRRSQIARLLSDLGFRNRII